jgi:hypothetical protein
LATLNLQVGATADDGNYSTGPDGGIDDADGYPSCGWVDDAFGNNENSTIWARFTGVSGLTTVTIQSATYQMYGSGNFGDAGIDIHIVAEKTAAPANPTSKTDGAGRTRTTEFTQFTGAQPTSQFNSYTVTDVIQELADAVNPSVILIFCDGQDYTAGTDHFHYIEAYETSSTNAPKLDITYVTHTIVSLSAFSQTQSMQTIDYSLAIDKAVTAFSQTQAQQAIASYWDQFLPVAAFTQTQSMQPIAYTLGKTVAIAAFTQTQTMQAINYAYDKTVALTAFGQTQTQQAIAYVFNFVIPISSFIQVIQFKTVTYAQELINWAGSVGSRKVGGPDVGQGMVGYDSPSSGFETTEGEN